MTLARSDRPDQTKAHRPPDTAAQPPASLAPVGIGRHRGEVTVTTKYGIPPAKNPGWIEMARSVARPVVKLERIGS